MVEVYPLSEFKKLKYTFHLWTRQITLSQYVAKELRLNKKVPDGFVIQTAAAKH